MSKFCQGLAKPNDSTDNMYISCMFTTCICNNSIRLSTRIHTNAIQCGFLDGFIKKTHFLAMVAFMWLAS